MAIKYCEKMKYYVVSYSARHPVTRKPFSKRRIGLKTKAEAQRVFNQLLI